VDEPRNALLFQGDPAEWERMLPLVRQMDRAARQVMIEVTIAEVTLDDNQEFGVSWFAKSPLDRFTGRLNFGTLPADGEGAASGGGLTYLLDLAGQNRALLRAFAEDERVSILSTPRLLVMSGKEASIDVGTEVPTLTTQTTSAQQTEGSSNLLQSIQYRKTGIILNIKPTVYSDDRIDLEISQEVSEALPLGDSSAISSPSIFNRSVTTSLSLRDGGSVILGGLMSSRETNSDSGVPVLKDVPLLGNLLKSQSKRKSKTELVLMIVPYVVGSDERAAELTRAISDRFELLELAPETGTLPPIDPER
jgi:general secretion pathway protein D